MCWWKLSSSAVLLQGQCSEPKFSNIKMSKDTGYLAHQGIWSHLWSFVQLEKVCPDDARCDIIDQNAQCELFIIMTLVIGTRIDVCVSTGCIMSYAYEIYFGNPSDTQVINLNVKNDRWKNRQTNIPPKTIMSCVRRRMPVFILRPIPT